MKTPLIRIEVRGGVAECVEKPRGIKVTIRDFDNEACGDESSVMTYEKNDKVVE